MVEFVFYLPEMFHLDEKIRELLESCKEKLKIKYRIETLDSIKEGILKDSLIPLCVKYGVGYQKTRKSKSLYPQLLVIENEKPIAFYPQLRKGEAIGIEDFLLGLLDRQVRGFYNADLLEKLIFK